HRAMRSRPRSRSRATRQLISLSLSTIYHRSSFSFFFFNDTATTEIYTLSLHDALPISPSAATSRPGPPAATRCPALRRERWRTRSEEHTSELQSRFDLVCRLLLEKKKA